MAISTYSELQTAVANWLDRDDLTARIPEFISLAEARFNRDLRIRAMETKQTASTVADQRNYALPTNYLQMRNLQVNGTPIRILEYVTPEMYDRMWGGTTTGTPYYYTIIADELQLGPTPAAVMTIEMLFYKRFDSLSSTTTTNWVLTNAPDVYLYAALMEAEAFLVNDARLPTWSAGYQRAIESLQNADAQDRHSGSAMRIMNTSGNP
jgi:hypothetical protein